MIFAALLCFVLHLHTSKVGSVSGNMAPGRQTDWKRIPTTCRITFTEALYPADFDINVPRTQAADNGLHRSHYGI